MIRIRIEGANHYEHMLELGANGFGCERERARFLEHDGNYVVPDVTFAEQLLPVVRSEGEQGGDVEHHLATLVLRVDGVEACGVRCHERKEKFNY